MLQTAALPGNACMRASTGLVDEADEGSARVGPVASWKDFPIRLGPAVRRLVEADEDAGAEERMIVAAVQDPGESCLATLAHCTSPAPANMVLSVWYTQPMVDMHARCACYLLANTCNCMQALARPWVQMKPHGSRKGLATSQLSGYIRWRGTQSGGSPARVRSWPPHLHLQHSAGPCFSDILQLHALLSVSCVRLHTPQRPC